MATLSNGRTKRLQAPPPPPSPEVLRFPRSRRNHSNKVQATAGLRRRQNSPLLPMHLKNQSHNATLEKLLRRENDEPPTICGPGSSVSISESPTSERRERVEEDECGEYISGAGRFEEEKWRFQAEICKMLRMEREFELKKLEINRAKIETTLKSAIHILTSVRRKFFEGESRNEVLDEEIKDLAEKMEQLQKSSGNKEDMQMDMLREKMEILSKGILNRVEKEYNSILSIAPNSSASTSKRIECPKLSDIATRQLYQEPVMAHENKCTGRCKWIVERIFEQVRAETDQWVQMQEMLAQVRCEMAELQESRDFWENRAYNLHHEIRSLEHTVEEWKEKAIRYEKAANGLQLNIITTLKEQIQNPNTDLSHPPLEKEKKLSSLRSKKNSRVDEKGSKYENEVFKAGENRTKKGLPAPLSLGKQLALDKRKILCHLKDNHNRGKKS